MKHSIFILVILISSSTVSGQDSVQNSSYKHKTSFWINFGSGWGGQQWAGSVAIGINPIDKWVFSTAVHLTDFSTAIFGTEDGTMSESYELVFGRIQRGRNFTAYATTGLGLVDVTEFKATGSVFPTSERERTSTFGIPLNSYILFHNNLVGIGLEFFLT